MKLNRTNQLSSPRKFLGGLNHKQMLQCYVVLAFPIIGLLVFTLYPMGWGRTESVVLLYRCTIGNRICGLEQFCSDFYTGYLILADVDKYAKICVI